MTKQSAGGPRSEAPPAFRFIWYPIYVCLTTLLLLPGALYLLLTRRHRPLLRRFRPAVPPIDRPLWIHACSVGELTVARPIIDELHRRAPNLPLLLTTSTVTGLQQAAKLPHVVVSEFPFDHPLIVRSFILRMKPRALVLIETELWPSALMQCRRASVPVALLNGRLSDKHFRRYARIGSLFRPVLSVLSLAVMQNAEHAARIARLGVNPVAVRIGGNTKFDAVPDEIPAAELDALRERHVLPLDAPVIVFGSTRPGDEALAAQCWRQLKDNHPALRLFVAPRHLDRLPEVINAFDAPVALRSRIVSGEDTAEKRVCILDTMGELTRFYALATVAVIGGSFFPGVEGHNPLEPAALGIPTIFGPYMRNFADSAALLLDADAAIQLRDPKDLRAALQACLNEPEERAALGNAARAVVAANRGAAKRQVDLLAQLWQNWDLS